MQTVEDRDFSIRHFIQTTVSISINLAAHEMPERQTQENLQRVIDEEIKIFGIDYKQILAITSDNGQNILAAVRCMKRLMGDALEGSLGSILRKEYSLIVNSCTSENFQTPEQTEINSSDEEEDVPESELQMIQENDDFVEEPSNETRCDDILLEDDQDDQMINLDIMESVRCGAHTAQLAVWDVLREYKTRLSNINKKCLKMHNKANRQTFLFHKIALPPKVCETRWNVWYMLLRYLKELEGTPFLALVQNNDSDIGKNMFLFMKRSKFSIKLFYKSACTKKYIFQTSLVNGHL